MKKLVLFTLVLVVCLSGTAFALLNDNQIPVAVDESAAVAASDSFKVIDSFNKDVDVNKNEASKGAVQATQGGTVAQVDVDVKDVLNNLKYQSPDNRSNYDNDNSTKTYVVDNAILANVNVAREFEDDLRTSNVFNKTQSAEIGCSFRDYNGVSNTNSAAGNMNNQTAFTKISIGSLGDGRR